MTRGTRRTSPPAVAILVGLLWVTAMVTDVQGGESMPYHEPPEDST